REKLLIQRHALYAHKYSVGTKAVCHRWLPGAQHSTHQWSALSITVLSIFYRSWYRSCSRMAAPSPRQPHQFNRRGSSILEQARHRTVDKHRVNGLGQQRGDRQHGELVEAFLLGNRQQIGRASCREREEIAGGDR